MMSTRQKPIADTEDKENESTHRITENHQITKEGNESERKEQRNYKMCFSFVHLCSVARCV